MTSDLWVNNGTKPGAPRFTQWAFEFIDGLQLKPAVRDMLTTIEYASLFLLLLISLTRVY